MTKTCSHCGDSYKSLGTHWRWNPSHRPQINDRRMDILTGLLMGDGTIPTHEYSVGSNINCHMAINNTNLKFLNWIKESLGELARGIKLVRESGKREILGKIYNQKDYYRLTTISHPSLNQLGRWYSSGKKRFPDDLNLTPLIAKMWYCCDGWITKGRFLKVGCSNETDRPDFIESLFPVSGICGKTDIGFTEEKSKHLFGWMGDPPPGMEYKWGEWS